MKKALFSVPVETFKICETKLVGLDYEARTLDGTTLVVVRDSAHYVGDPVAYVANVFSQKAAKAFY